MRRKHCLNQNIFLWLYAKLCDYYYKNSLLLHNCEPFDAFSHDVMSNNQQISFQLPTTLTVGLIMMIYSKSKYRSLCKS